jgi:hypothetical protein
VNISQQTSAAGIWLFLGHPTSAGLHHHDESIHPAICKKYNQIFSILFLKFDEKQKIYFKLFVKCLLFHSSFRTCVLYQENKEYIQSLFSAFWEYDLYPWNLEILRYFARNWDFFSHHWGIESFPYI